MKEKCEQIRIKQYWEATRITHWKTKGMPESEIEETIKQWTKEEKLNENINEK